MPAVYSSRRAEPAQSAWLQRLLGPLESSCRFEKRLPPLEVRPTGKWSGFCEDRQFVPDGRVAISSKKVSFWNDEKLIELYLHECSHRLLDQQDVDSHGPEFLCINAILLMRAAPSFGDSVVSKLSFYDCQDRPAALLFEPGWRSIVIDFALAVATELALTTMAAEDLAEVVCARWLAHLQERDDERQQAAQQVLQAARTCAQRAEQLAELRFSRLLFFWCSVLGWGGFLSVSSVVFFNP